MDERLRTTAALRARAIALGLTVLVFIATTALALTSGDRLRFPDELDYHRQAERIVAGEGYVDAGGSPTAYRAPGYPIFLSLVYHLSSGVPAAKLANAVLYAATAWLLALLAARLHLLGQLFAPLLLLLYPIGLYTASTLYPQTLGALLLVAVVLLLTRPGALLGVSWAAGLLLGLLVLTIPSFLPLVPALALVVLVTRRANWANALRHGALLLSGVVLMVTPWTVRNAIVFGALVPVSTNSGENLLLGNSENARPNSGVNVDLSTYLLEVEGVGEAERDARLRELAIQWVQENPRRAAQLYAQKVLNFFNFRNELATAAEGSALRDLVSAATYYPLLGLALLRLAFLRRYPWSYTEGVMYALYLAGALLSAIFFTRIRFRVPFDMLLIAIVAAFLGALLTGLTRPNAQATSAPDRRR